ncbi:hypothetical protein Gotri_014302 [Gossypium trilobum]|uniref:Uncharacterized protein n=1 Tax=Gossypium trilobum TaxID=34281 RepID=A0A7J9DWG5_9ROSI|nr:hypothetical protein [Gossypium trilobum]
MIILIAGLRLNLSLMMIFWPIYWLIHLFAVEKQICSYEIKGEEEDVCQGS